MQTADVIKVLKQARKLAREQEIALYGKPICYHKVVQSKKKYTRKNKHKNKYYGV